MCTACACTPSREGERFGTPPILVLGHQKRGTSPKKRGLLCTQLKLTKTLDNNPRPAPKRARWADVMNGRPAGNSAAIPGDRHHKGMLNIEQEVPQIAQQKKIRGAKFDTKMKNEIGPTSTPPYGPPPPRCRLRAVSRRLQTSRPCPGPTQRSPSPAHGMHQPSNRLPSDGPRRVYRFAPPPPPAGAQTSAPWRPPSSQCPYGTGHVVHQKWKPKPGPSSHQLLLSACATHGTALEEQPAAVGGLTDGGWRVTDGGWRVTDGGWRVTDGGWWVTNGGWKGGGSPKNPHGKKIILWNGKLSGHSRTRTPPPPGGWCTSPAFPFCLPDVVH